MAASATQKAARNPLGKAFVRVTGSRLGRFVEFEFSVNDADLTIELILPFSAFDEFCLLQSATVLPPEQDVADQLQQLAWRSRQPGLLRRVKRAVDGDQAGNARERTRDG